MPRTEQDKALRIKREYFPKKERNALECFFLDSILEAMETKCITRKELAERLRKSQAYVSKTLNAGALNFTLKTMVNLSLALGLRLSLSLEDPASTEAGNWKNRTNVGTAAPPSHGMRSNRK